MKNNALNILFSLLLMLSISVSNALPNRVYDDVNNNPLLLNGKVTDMEVFSWVTTGKLSVAVNNPSTGSKTAVPFYIYIHRGGKIVDGDSYAHNHTVVEYEMADILKQAKEGDQIIIDPAGNYEQAGRKVIVVKQKRFMFNLDWWLQMNRNNKKDGC